VAGWRADQSTRGVADDGHRRPEFADAVAIARQYGVDRGVDVEILGLNALEVVRLKAVPGPAAGRCAVILERAANPIVGADMGEQSGELGYRCPGSVASQFEQLPDFFAGVPRQDGRD